MGNGEGAADESAKNGQGIVSGAPTLESLAAEIGKLTSRIAKLEASKKLASNDSDSVASDRDLDSDHGDPVIRFGLKEKYWPEQPDPNIGYKFSECSPEYLDATAKYLSAVAWACRRANGSQPADEKKAGYKEKDAARARGWAARIRARGGVPFATPAEEQQAAAEEEIPF